VPILPGPLRRAGRRTAALGAALPLLALALTGCGSGPRAGGGPSSAANPIASVHEVPSVAALLPASVRSSGVLDLVSSVGAPPSAYYPNGDSGTVAGQDIDFGNAVAAVLGLRVQRQEGAFDTVLPGLQSGKWQVGTGNFGVTETREKTVDFVTYIDDGQGFAVAGGSPIKKITKLTDLCGLTVGTGQGTTFQATLEQNADVCAKAGRKPFQVKVYSDTAAVLLGLQQGRFDVLFSTINGLRYQQQATGGAVRFINGFHRLDVGFAFAKGSPLTRAFQAAVNELIKDGTYQRILRKWGTTASAITRSRISPPELTD
jgi:polar amino acid transport system substrate-binding protein